MSTTKTSRINSNELPFVLEGCGETTHANVQECRDFIIPEGNLPKCGLSKFKPLRCSLSKFNPLKCKISLISKIWTPTRSCSRRKVRDSRQWTEFKQESFERWKSTWTSSNMKKTFSEPEVCLRESVARFQPTSLLRTSQPEEQPPAKEYVLFIFYFRSTSDLFSGQNPN